MSKPTEKVTLTLSHNQEIAGEEHKAGAKVEVDSRLARVLVSRGAAKAPVKAPSEATVADLRALAEQRGVDLKGVSHKADIQAALEAAPAIPAATAEKGGKR